MKSNVGLAEAKEKQRTEGRLSFQTVISCSTYPYGEKASGRRPTVRDTAGISIRCFTSCAVLTFAIYENFIDITAEVLL
jgi:hypothetical protein